MGSGIKNAFIFGTGAVIGSFVTWRLLKTKYERIAQEEIDSVKEVYSKRQSEPNQGETEKCAFEKPETMESIKEDYKDILNDCGYSDVAKDVVVGPKPPYVISPEEFGDDSSYDQIDLVYYEDGILTEDGSDIIVENADEVVGDFVKHFGEYEDDSVYVRNEALGVDYAIIADPRPYSQIVRKRYPHEMED